MWDKPCGSLGKNLSSKGNRLCKVLEKGVSLICLRMARRLLIPGQGEWKGRVLGEEGQEVMGTLSRRSPQAAVMTLAFSLREMGSHGRILSRKEVELLTGFLSPLCHEETVGLG